MTDSITYLAALPADSGAILAAHCQEGELTLTVMTDELIGSRYDSGNWADVLIRFDNSPAASDKWFISPENKLALVSQDHVASWLPVLIRSESLRIQLPVRGSPRKVFRWSLRGTDSALAWLDRAACLPWRQADSMRRERQHAQQEVEREAASARAEKQRQAALAQAKKDAEARERLLSSDPSSPWVSARDIGVYYPNRTNCKTMIQRVDSALIYFRTEPDARRFGRILGTGC